MSELSDRGSTQPANEASSFDKNTKFVKGHAVVIAVANYTHVNPLPDAVLNDARDVAAVLASSDYCGYDSKQINVLLDSQATLGAIRQALADLASASLEEDSVFVFFSGHGARLKQGGNDMSVLLPIDCRPDEISTTTLSEAEFSQALAAIPARRLVVVLDACHSGGAGSLKGTTSMSIEYGFDEKALQRLAEGTGRVIMASSRATETSLVLNGARNSVFTETLLEALRGQAQTSADGLIRVFEVFNYLSEKVKTKVQGRQHPIFKASDLEDNFPIALYRGGAKAVGGQPNATVDERLLSEIMTDLYPAGPVDQEIWTRAGGDISCLRLGGSGRAMWFAALKILRQGGGGRGLSAVSLMRTALEDFPHNAGLKALIGDSS